MFTKNEVFETPYFIAEVGQNHNGDLDLALEYIRVFALEGANAIKFQTRNNKYLFDRSAYNAQYASENAFAPTYGEHRERLELKPEWLLRLKDECEAHGVKFMSTPFDEPSLKLLDDVGVDIIKIASFDLGNIPFLDRVARLMKPVVMSTGGGGREHIRISIDTIASYHKDLAVLHCVSEYPCSFDRLGLHNIAVLSQEFPEFCIGSSDHFNGILSGPVAYLQGARVFEKHVTLNRASKGTDHSFALEREGFRKFVRDVNRVRHMLPTKHDVEIGQEYVFQKLGKSIIALTDIEAGEELTLENLSGKIFQSTYIPVRESFRLIGKKALSDIKSGQPITESDFL